MDKYIDIKLKPDDEIRENLLMDLVYTKFHKRLYELKSKNIGVSFPDAKVKLGRKLRINGTFEYLNQLNQINWLGGLISYCTVSEITDVPNTCKYYTVSRIQSNMTIAKLRRLVKRGSIKPEEIPSYRAKIFNKSLNQPYLELHSASNGQKHRRYIKFGEILDTPKIGDFDYFGLSKEATVPLF